MALVPCSGCSRLVRSIEATCPFCDARGVSSAAIFALGLAVAGCHGTPTTSSTDGVSPAPPASIVATPSAAPSAVAAPAGNDPHLGELGGLVGLGSGSPDRMHGTVYGGPPPPLDDASAPRTTGNVTFESTGSVGTDDRTIAGLRPRLRSCYQQGLANDPTMEGTAVFRVEVSATGTAQASTKSTMGLSKEVEACMLKKLASAGFDPAPAHAIELRVVAKKQTP